MAKKAKKQQCPIEAAGVTYIDYKDVAFLKRFLSKYNRIVPRQYSGTTLGNQKKLAVAVKRARYMALLPYVVNPRHTTFAEHDAPVPVDVDVPTASEAVESTLDVEAVAV